MLRVCVALSFGTEGHMPKKEVWGSTKIPSSRVFIVREVAHGKDLSQKSGYPPKISVQLEAKNRDIWNRNRPIKV